MTTDEAPRPYLKFPDWPSNSMFRSLKANFSTPCFAHLKTRLALVHRSMSQVSIAKGEQVHERSADSEVEEASKRMKMDNDSEAVSKEPRLPKTKVALLVGYCGFGYQGLQM